MRITVKVGILVAAFWILIKMIFFYNGWNTRELLPILVLLNILGILLAVSIGLYLQKRKDKKESVDGNALRDIKSAMTAGVPYTILVGVFLYFYYANIDPGYNERQIADAEVQILQSLESPEGLQEIRESNQKYEVMGKQEIYEEMREGPKNLYNAKFTMTVSLLAMLVLTTVNSIVITIIYRKLIFRS